MVVLGFTADSELALVLFCIAIIWHVIPALVGIAGLVQPQRTVMHTVYELPAAVFCGRICYGLYIWHFPVFMVISESFRPRYISTFLIGCPIAFALAISSYYLIERHFMRTRPL